MLGGGGVGCERVMEHVTKHDLADAIEEFRCIYRPTDIGSAFGLVQAFQEWYEKGGAWICSCSETRMRTTWTTARSLTSWSCREL